MFNQIRKRLLSCLILSLRIAPCFKNRLITWLNDSNKNYTITTKSYPTKRDQLHESTLIIIFYPEPCFYPND